jgi:hypothetical protein
VLDGSLTVGSLNADECDIEGYRWVRFGSPTKAETRRRHVDGAFLWVAPTFRAPYGVPHFRVASLHFGDDIAATTAVDPNNYNVSGGDGVHNGNTTAARR